MVDIKQLRSQYKEMWHSDQKAIQIGVREAESVFRNNTSNLQEIIRKHGWPFSWRVGDRAADVAWLVAQHSDHDVAFQAQALGFLITELSRRKRALQNCAYLIDRILVNLGAKQIYGSQVDPRCKPPQVYRLVAPDQVNAMRRLLGMESLETYVYRMRNL